MSDDAETESAWVPAENRRAAQRIKTLKSGWIVFAADQCKVDCAVFDLSDTGARLKPTDASLIPTQFKLYLRHGPPRHCRIVWEAKGELGVCFTE